MKKFLLISTALIAVLFMASCKKSPTPTPTPVDPCLSKTIVVAGTTTPTSNPTATNGSIAASATGSTGFSFSLNGAAAQASGTFSGLAVGTYTVTAKDAEGCSGAKSFTINVAACPTISVTGLTTQTTNATALNGTITATGSGSTGLTYSLNAGAFQATGLFINLAVGAYTVTAKDVNGCLGSQMFTVTAASCPTITVSGSTTVASNATAANGSISASAIGSTGITFSLNGGPFQATGNFSAVAAGNYIVTAKDVNNCTGVMAFVVGVAPCPTITASATPTTTVKCATTNTGTLTLGGSGGLAPYTYSINGGAFQAASLFSALPTGAVGYTVKDANGCTATGSSTIAFAAAGPMFTTVKNLLATYCISCHGGATPQSGINFTDDCTIVSKAARIKARAVDANPSQMPPSGAGLTASERTAVTNWVTAGGNHNN